MNRVSRLIVIASLVIGYAALAIVIDPAHLRASAAPLRAIPATTTVYLPNITKTLGGPDGWNTPFIVQNIGQAPADVTMDFYTFSDGRLVKTRSVSGLKPGTSVFHDPMHDPELPDWNQFSVVVKSYGSPIVTVVNEHQNQRTQNRQEALSYRGLDSGSTRMYLPYVADQVNGWYTTFIMQNLGGANANVTISLVSFDGAKKATLLRTISPGRSQFVDPRVESSLVTGVEYAADIASDQPLGVVVNSHNDAADVQQPRAFSYNGVPASSVTEAWLPYVALNSDGVGRSSRIIVQNIGTQPARPSLFFRAFGQTEAVRVDGASVIPAGQSATFEPGAVQGLIGGEFALHVTGGQFAVLAAALSPGTAMAYTNDATGFSNRLYAPNVTRTLGGPNGWTTPIILQAKDSDVTSATLSWYRFSDGALIKKQVVLGLHYGTSIRVDPRALSFLNDDTQYAVVIEAPTGGVAAIVTELNFQGGDGAMAYEAFQPPSEAAYGVSNCSPAGAPAGTTFTCRLYGLPPGAAPVNVTVTQSNGTPSSFSSQQPVASDGTWLLEFTALFQATRTVTVTAGGKTATTLFIVIAPSFSITVTPSTYGNVGVQTLPGIACTAMARLPNGNIIDSDPQITDANGRAAWTYPTTQTNSGTGTHEVTCTSGAETLSRTAPFNVP